MNSLSLCLGLGALQQPQRYQRRHSLSYTKPAVPRTRWFVLEAIHPSPEPCHEWIISDRKEEPKVGSYNRYSSKENHRRKELQWRENGKQHEIEEKNCQGIYLRNELQKRKLYREESAKERKGRRKFLERSFFNLTIFRLRRKNALPVAFWKKKYASNEEWAQCKQCTA
jgi:hypothetical protein